MKAFARYLCVLSLTAFFVACGGYGGDATTAVSATAPPPSTPPPPTPPTADYAVLELDPLPGDVRAQAHDINENGHIVGFSGSANETAVLWTIDAAGVVTVQDLGLLTGGTRSKAFGINNLGQIVGLADGALGTLRPFIWTANNGMRDLGVPVGLVGGIPRSINDAGQVVGSFIISQTNNTFEETFGIWIVDNSGATIDERNIGNLGGKTAIAFDNNVHGNVAGDIFFDLTGSGSNQTGFFWSEAGGVIEIDTEEALGINDNDEVVGVRLTSGNDAYVWSAAGGLSEISGGIASAINNSRQVTGRPNSAGAAFIWDDGDLKFLPLPENRDFAWAQSISEAGWIAGWTTNVGGNEFATLWMPN